MTVKEITNKKIWDEFVLNYPIKSFLHSWSWGEFNKNTEDKIFRLGVFEGDSVLGVALIIKVKAKRGTFLFCPHGPLIDWNDRKQFGVLVEYLKKLSKAEKCSFVRISPLILENSDNQKLFGSFGFRPAPIHMHAEITWTLDISKSEDELMKEMRKTTRYCVKRAIKDGVKIEMSKNISDVEVFNNVHKATVERHKFVPFSLHYLEEQFKEFSKEDEIVVLKASYCGEVLASSIIVFYGESAFYHHGASTNKYPKIPASYLMQWEAIREAKRRGKKIYNFWGIAPTDNPKHPFHGITTFKMGFGGSRTDYMHAQDLPLSFGYFKAWLVDTVRSKKRGFK